MTRVEKFLDLKSEHNAVKQQVYGIPPICFTV